MMIDFPCLKALTYLIHMEIKILNIARIAFLIVIFTALINMDSKGQNFPAGFSRVKLATLKSPCDLDFAPDGRIFIAEKGGNIMIYKNGALLSTPFIHLDPNQVDERGIGGVVLDPNFSTNQYVYIYYTTNESPVHNRLIRVTANGDVALDGSKITLLDIEAAESTFHHGGGMAFGPDGKLYLGVGEDHKPSNAPDLNTYKGKVLRLNPDGTAASGNPFSSSEKAKFVWTYGHRNPYTVSIQPGTGKIFVSEVGEWTWEEINDVTPGGKNFGWPSVEGFSNNTAFTNPVFSYSNLHGAPGNEGGCAITGGTFMTTNTNYPSAYHGAFFYADFCNGWMRYLDLNNGGDSKLFATGLGEGLIRVKTGPDGSLYHVGTGTQQGLYKIIYSTNDSPLITSHPVNLTTSEQRPATFSVSASGANPLSYQWLKNGAVINGATGVSYTIPMVVAGDAGGYSVKVTNSFGSVTSNSATLTVNAFNGQSVATITSPVAGTFYKGGDVISFTATATDPEDGVLPASAYSWIEEFHHSTHIHPGAVIPSGITSGSFTIGKVGEVSADVFHRLILVVKDSKGLTDTAFVDIFPKTAILNLTTQPAGLQVTWDGQPQTTPFEVTAVAGMTISMGVISPQIGNGMTYNYDRWSDGGDPTHDITVPETNTGYIVMFNSVTGISEASPDDHIAVNVFPNPNQGSFKVEVSLDPSNTDKVSIELINALGQLIYLRKQDVVKANITDHIELRNAFPSGIYTLKVKVGNRVKSTRVSLMR